MHMASLDPTGDPHALWSRLDISYPYRRIYTDSEPRDRLSNLQPCLANVRSATKDTAGQVHMRSTCELRTRVWTFSSRPPYTITTSQQANWVTLTRGSARILNMNLIRALQDWTLMHFVQTLHTSLMLKSSILPQPVPGNRIILKALEK